MNRFFLIFILLMVICSCTNQKVNNSASADTASGGLFTQTDSIKIKINSNFPFGCSDLLKFYPKYWERDLENYGHLEKPLGNEFDDIGKCFAAINSAKTISSPTPKSVELLKIGNNFKNIDNLDTFKQRSIDSCRYRLPNIGRYECYYYFNRYGNLLLLDKKTNKAKLLNIYADDLSSDSHTILRYFLIDKNFINIYEVSCYDDGCSLDKKYKIVINPNGEIKISHLIK